MRRFITSVLLVSLSLFVALAESSLEDFVPVPGMTIGEDFIAFEAEATMSPLGLWEIIGPDDVRYKDSGMFPPINRTHVEFTGNDKNGGDATSPLDYTFRCPKTGTYCLGARLFQRLEGEPDDKCNDVYVRMSGNFTSGNASVSLSDLQHDQKFFGRGVDTWGALYSLEVHSTGYKGAAMYNLTKGEVYTLTVSGRAQRTNIDYWLLYDTSLPITLAGHKDLMGVNDALYRPVIYNCNSYDAVDMNYTGIDGFVDASIQRINDLKILQVKDRLQWAAAQMVYQGTNGDAFFTINAMQESDGESSYRLRVNGELIGEVTNDRIYGTDIADYTIQSHRLNASEVALDNGDTICVEFNNTTNGLVPEGDVTATSRGRWLSLDICTTGDFATYVFSLLSDEESLQLNDSLILGLDKLLPFNVDDDLEWMSTDSDVVSVDDEGQVLALQEGVATIRVQTVNGEFEDSCLIVVYNSLPFASEAIAIPGVIEAENFDVGGEGKAYHDVLPYNAGNTYRQGENVDIEECTDGGYNLKLTQEGEWLVYTLEVVDTGAYSFHYNVASASDNCEFNICIDGEVFMPSVVVNNTGGLNEFKTYVVEGLDLSLGRHVLKLSFETDGIDMSWMGFFLPSTVFKVTDVTLSTHSFRLDADDEKELEAVVLPVVAEDKSLTWSSSDEHVARVDSWGVVTGLNQGKAYIKASSADGLVADSAQVSVFGYTAGVDELQALVSVFPNPSASGVFLLYDDCYWQVFDFLGLKVAEGETATVDISTLGRGVYILTKENACQRLLYK